MNWKSIEQLKGQNDVLLRVDYKTRQIEYMIGYLSEGNVRWYNNMTGDSGFICKVSDIGSGMIAAVYFLDPREILL